MQIKFLVIAKTSAAWLIQGEDEYRNRLRHYCKFTYQVLPPVKQGGKLPKDALKKKEGALILQALNPRDQVVLLDERGKQGTSPAFARFLEGRFHHGGDLVFVVGGAYGFAEEVYQRANHQWALSSQTYSHQMVRVLFLEQLYRAFTIIRGEQYHH